MKWFSLNSNTVDSFGDLIIIEEKFNIFIEKGKKSSEEKPKIESQEAKFFTIIVFATNCFKCSEGVFHLHF
jgi:hypothetical protein